MSITGPYPLCTSGTLSFPTSISFEDDPIPFSFDVSNAGDTDTPAVEWGFIVELFLTQGEYVSVHRFPYSLPSTFIIPSLESKTLSGEFHPSRTHTSFSQNVYYELGQALTQGNYEYQITVNRTVNGNLFFAQDQAGYQDGNDYFQDNAYGEITIGGSAEFKKEDEVVFECGTVISFKPPVRNKIIRCGVIGDTQTTKTVTKPKTTTTGSTTGPTITTGPTLSTESTITIPPITTTTIITISTSDQTITQDTITLDPGDPFRVRTNPRLPVDPIPPTTTGKIIISNTGSTVEPEPPVGDRSINVPSVSVSDTVVEPTTGDRTINIPSVSDSAVQVGDRTINIPTVSGSAVQVGGGRTINIPPVSDSAVQPTADRSINVPSVTISDIGVEQTGRRRINVPPVADPVLQPVGRTIKVPKLQDTLTQQEPSLSNLEPTNEISVIVSNLLKTLQTDTVRLLNELTVRPVKYAFISNQVNRATVIAPDPIPIRKEPVPIKNFDPSPNIRKVTPKPILVNTRPTTTLEKIGIQDPLLPGSLQFIISPGRVVDVLPQIQFNKVTPVVPDESNFNELLGLNEFQDEFLLAQRIKELVEVGEITTVYYNPKPPERAIPLRFVSLNEGELKKARFDINSPIINYWEAIDYNPPEVPINIESTTQNESTTYRNIPKNYVPFAKTKKLDKIERVEPTRISLPGLATVDPDSLQKRGDWKPYLDQYGLIYSNGFPISKNLINKLWKYYTVANIDSGLQYITEDVRIDYPSSEEIQGELFNSLATEGLIWPDKLPSWLIPWYQQNETTMAGSFLVFNPRLYAAASKAFGFRNNLSLLVETPKEERAELSFDRESVLPDKIVLMLRNNDKENTKFFKTSNAFVDNTLSYYEVVTDIDEMTERFTPPGEVIYVHYDDPILRLMLHPSAKIGFSRSQLSLKSFGDKELIHTIPHSYIIIPTDDPQHTSLRGTGSLALSFGSRSLTLTQSTCPDEWAAPSKPVLDIVGSYIDVWGYDPFYNGYYLGENYTYPEGTFKLVFSDTVKNFKPFTTDYKYIKLSKNVFEHFLDSQNEVTTNDVAPSFNKIIENLDTKDLLTLQGSLQTTVIRELSEGEVTGRSAPLEVDQFNPAQDNYYISTGDVLNDIISDFLNAQLDAAANADFGDLPTFPPILGS